MASADDGEKAASAAGTLVARVRASSAPVWPFAIFVVVALALWIGSAAYTNTALFPDVTEQFIWSKSLEWGYYKHPPLTTWIFAAVIGSIGSHIWVPGLLSGFCLAATGWLTWAIAGRVLGRRAAFYCLLLWSLQQPFSLRAYIYNHNVPLVLFSALTVWTLVAVVALSTVWTVLRNLQGFPLVPTVSG